MSKAIQDFLDRHCLNTDAISMDDLCSRFIDAMHDGLSGKKSPLAMIGSYCFVGKSPEAGQSVIVIDAGGTNLRSCLVTFKEDGTPEISRFRKTAMPGTLCEVTPAGFFGGLADSIEDLIDLSDRIGFCFSYEAEITADHDGIPRRMSKEIKAPGILGKHLGKELLAELGRRGHDVSAKKVLVLNDTVATLLAAQAAPGAKSYDGYIGFILGTGTNTAYIEKDGQIINVESGGMDFCPGDIDREFVSATADPGKAWLEKMISGAYLGPLAYKVIKAAEKEGLFSAAFTDAFASAQNLRTSELSAFLAEDPDCLLSRCASDDDDYDTLFEILGAFTSRAAMLTAANLASAVLVTDFGKDEDHPVLINADGTTFHRTAMLKNLVTEYLDAYLSEKGRRAVITAVDNSPVIGSAIGALSI
ncbi:MAG: hexokinase [Spirochaetales bacterium]|nr:hexokinase [Spirochaetales bacterium]